MKVVNCYFLIIFFFSFVFVVFAQDNNDAQKETKEEKPSCQKLITPKTGEDVAALQKCIRDKKSFTRQESQKNKIQKSVERDRILREGDKVPGFCIYDARNKKSCVRVKSPQPPN